MKKSEFIFTAGKILVDGLAVFGALVFAYFVRMHWFGFFDLPSPASLFPLDDFVTFASRVTFILVLIFAVNGRYEFGVDEKRWDEFRHLFGIIQLGWRCFWYCFTFRNLRFSLV